MRSRAGRLDEDSALRIRDRLAMDRSTHGSLTMDRLKTVLRTGFINASQPGRHIPQGLKPACLLALGGTAEAVPFPKPFMKPALLSLRFPNASATLGRAAHARRRLAHAFQQFLQHRRVVILLVT